MGKRIEVGVLGATGMVGQQFINQLAGHPWFELTWLAASERSEGKRYADAAPWRLETPIPDGVAERDRRGVRLRARARGSCSPPSTRPSRGSSSRRSPTPATSCSATRATTAWNPVVPLLVPEVNADHLALLRVQARQRGGKGAIVTNPNCSTIVLSMALAPLRAFGLRACLVTHDAGRLGRRLPRRAVARHPRQRDPVHLAARKRRSRPRRARSSARSPAAEVEPHPVRVSAHTNRVPVVDGHTEPSPWRSSRSPCARGAARGDRRLRRRAAASGACRRRRSGRSCTWTQPNRPQPRLDAGRGRGMTVSVGRLRPCGVLDWKFVALGHNTVRGAAGASVLNAELMQAAGPARAGRMP